MTDMRTTSGSATKTRMAGKKYEIDKNLLEVVIK